MTSYIGPLVQESTPSIIADKLRQAIAHGELKPGAQLGEADLARKLGVSRGPLREGMQRLTQEGLLVAIRNRGLFVRDMTPGDVRDMYFAREAIERAAARKILDGDHMAAGDELLQIVDQMAAAGTPAEVSELDIAFTSACFSWPAARGCRGCTRHSSPRPGCASTRSMRATPNRRCAMRAPIPGERDPLGDRELTDRLLTAHMDDAIRRLTDATAVMGGARRHVA